MARPSAPPANRVTTRRLLPTALAGWALAVLAGYMTGLLAFKGGCQEQAAAQLSLGATGLVAGGTCIRMARVAGGTPTATHGLLLALIHAAMLIAGATPLFAAVGFTVKLSLLAFYSFSFAGALGSLAIHPVLKSAFQNRLRGHPATLLAIGYFSLGLAAGAGSAMDLMAPFLPKTVLTALSILAMIAIAGTGSAATVALFPSDRTNRRKKATRVSDINPPGRVSGERATGLALVCILVPFYLNDLANIYVRNWSYWLAIDYLAVKAFPLLLITYLVKTRRITLDKLGLAPQKPLGFICVFLMGTLSVLFIWENKNLVAPWVPGYVALGGIPKILSPFWHQFDLYAGLFLVAIVEEVVFRGLWVATLEKVIRNPFVIALLSAVAFGLIHWSAGFANVWAAFLTGMLYMALYMRTRSLPAIILSHFVVDLVLFSKWIPAGLLVFM